MNIYMFILSRTKYLIFTFDYEDKKKNMSYQYMN